MQIDIATVKVYTPDEGKAIKLSQDGKVVTYLQVAYYELPGYNYDVEEVDIKESDKFYNKLKRTAKNLCKLVR